MSLDALDNFIQTREKMREERQEKEKKLGISKMDVRAIKDFANAILDKANYIEFTQLAAENGEIISYEDARKIIKYQRELIDENIDHLKFYVKKETDSTSEV